MNDPQSIGSQQLTPILCFCHLRWNFVYQRPQHLLTRCEKLAQVHLWEEPLFEDEPVARLASTATPSGVRVLTPILPRGTTPDAALTFERELLDSYVANEQIENFIAWYYTPMALRFSDHLTPEVTVYDCMDELSAFHGAPPELIAQEQRLFDRADVVFAGGSSLYSSKRRQHANVHLFPSSIDRHHFAAGRLEQPDPEDQRSIPHPRIGFFGVVDERLDRELLRQVAAEHPEWHFVMVGPVVKISENDLPRGQNLHYLGQKSYADLPQYLANWDVAMLPFARNAATEFISPTKTPEYLAAGKPVVSTPIRDVAKPYGEMGLVKIAADAQQFGEAIDACLHPEDDRWLEKVDRFLSNTSWDKTFEGMWKEIQRCSPQHSGSSAAYIAEKRSGTNV
ncbi:MAG TPA: glycosyltransferase family 1 protein [Acidobacteriaceae bacterium]